MATAAGAHHPELPQFMTVLEVASALRVSRATIYRLIHAGALPGARIGKSVRVSRRAVEAFVDNDVRHEPHRDLP